MGKTNYLEDELLRWCTGQANDLDNGIITPYVGLFTAAPTDAGGGTEVSTSSTGYARVSAAGKFPAPASGTITNNAVISFPTPLLDWGTIVAVGLFDAITGGHLLRYIILPASAQKTINASDPSSFAAGALIFRED